VGTLGISGERSRKGETKKEIFVVLHFLEKVCSDKVYRDDAGVYTVMLGISCTVYITDISGNGKASVRPQNRAVFLTSSSMLVRGVWAPFYAHRTPQVRTVRKGS
jgi:hypothetical protein